MITRPPSVYGAARSPGRPGFVSVEPEQGEVINGPALGDLSRRRAGPSAGNRSAAKPLEHEPEFVLSETFDPFRAT